MSTEAGAKLAERLWIARLGTYAPGGYNLTLGGDGALGHFHSEETRRRMSEQKRGVPKPPFSDEHRRKLSEAHLGKPKSDAHRRKMSESQIGRKLSAAHCELIRKRQTGKVASAETRAKMSAVHKARYERKHRLRDLAWSYAIEVMLPELPRNEYQDAIKTARELLRR